MKKHIKYLSFCLLAAIGLASCEKDDDGYRPDIRELEGYAYLEDRTITTFDVNEELEIDLFSNDNVSIESIEILKDGESIATANIISDSVATFSTSALSSLDTINVSDGTVSVPITIRSALSNGKDAEDVVTLSVKPVITLKDTLVKLKFMDTTTTELSYSIYTFGANVDQVSLFRKTTEDSEFVATDIDLPTDEGAINLGDIDYDELGVGIGDTIFYQFVAESGALSQAVEAEVVIQTQDFGSATTTTLSTNPAMNAYNLGQAAYVNDTIPAEITFKEPMGFATTDGIDFVKAAVPNDMTTAEYVAALDLFEAETIYEEGNPMTSVDEVEMGDVYIYKVERDDVVYYGIITVGDVTTVNEESVSFDFEHAEGTIIRE